MHPNRDNLAIIPVRSYLNADVEKFTILQDNKDRIGIYRWVNTKTGKFYIGSSKNLSVRFRQYFNIVYLENRIPPLLPN